MRQVRLLDTTLRDGTMTPRASFDSATRVAIARRLEAAGVEIIEAGFPARAAQDRLGIDAVIDVCERATVCALSRAHEEDIDEAAALLVRARRSRLHVFAGGATRQPADLVAQAARAVRHAVERADEVQFSLLDSTRLPASLFGELVHASAEAGATTIGLTDTLGVALPSDVTALVEQAARALPAGSTAALSFHGHDDLGLATACAIAAVAAGATQLEVCVNGLGPRAGNTALEEVVGVLARHGARLGVSCAVDPASLRALSKVVAERTGVNVPPAKPIVGEQALGADLEVLLR